MTSVSGAGTVVRGRVPIDELYLAFVEDVYSRMIVGWSLQTHMPTSLVTEALEMAVWRRGVPVEGLVHHSDAGVRYTSVLYSEQLGAHGIAPSVGSVGESFDNAMAESGIGLYKAELVWRRGPRAHGRSARDRDARIRRLVQPPPAARSHQSRPAGGVRADVPRFMHGGGDQRLNVSTEPRTFQRRVGGRAHHERGGQCRHDGDDSSRVPVAHHG